jgi:hypothetical protein
MSAIFWIISGIILITLYFLYAGVIMKKNKVKEASAGIDVQLKKDNEISAYLAEVVLLKNSVGVI